MSYRLLAGYACAGFLLVVAHGPAQAQGDLIQIDRLKGAWPTPSLVEALETPYGKAVLEKATAALSSGATAECRAQKQLTDAAYRTLAVQILDRSNDTMRDAFRQAFDSAKASAAFDRVVSADDLERQKKNFGSTAPADTRDVARNYAAVRLVDRAVEQAAQAIRLARIELPKSMTALEDGEAAVIDIGENVELEFESMMLSLEDDDRKAVETIASNLDQAMAAGINRQKLLSIGPSLIIPVVMPLLADHCIQPK